MHKGPTHLSALFYFKGLILVYISILYQDEDLIVVNKPAGLNTHPDDGQTDEASFDLVTLVRRQLSLDYLGVHHRLDREVSGVLAFAARREANAGLARAFEGRQALKEYLAIGRGRLPRRSGVIDLPVSEAPGGLWRVSRPGEAAKPALTRYRVAQEGPGGTYSLVHLTLETGRTHQLRLHLAQLGCPIVGDNLYGKPQELRVAKRPKARAGKPQVKERPDPPSGDTFPRLLLHARKLSFAHPVTGLPLSFEAPPPAIFARAASGQPLPELTLAERLASKSIADLKEPDRAGLGGLLTLAAERRIPLMDDPTANTTAYRLVNGAGDGLPGVTLDRYGPALVLNCYDPSLERDHPALKLLLAGVERQWPESSIYAKFRPRQLSNLGSPSDEVAPTLPLLGSTLPQVTIQENGLNYLIQPGEGLSPGLFLDMREVRARLASWVAGRNVLNCFSFTGAFGLVALSSGAGRVLNLDAGRKVLDWSKQNYEANGLTPDEFDFVEGDVFDWLGRFARRQQTFEVVILDPPSYSTVKKTRWAAQKNYGELAELAARVVAPGGLLLACTNHAGLPRRTFRQMVLKGLEGAGREAQVIGFYHEPDLDFPRLGTTEGYLKVLALRLR